MPSRGDLIKLMAEAINYAISQKNLDEPNVDALAEVAFRAIEAVGYRVEPARTAALLKIAQSDARAEFQRRDNAWGAELSIAFGSKAGNIRYTNRGRGEPGSTLRSTYDLREAARIAYDRAMGIDLDGSDLVRGENVDQ